MPNELKKIMLIDDNEIDLKINARIITLTKLFEEIIICQSGEESLDYLNKHMDNPEKLPNFILLDIQMPEMDGFDYLDHYKQLPATFTGSCPVAMLSSTLDFGDIKKAEANVYVVKLLKKPLMPMELAELINKKAP
ncbi:response regulator [Pedobacter insulae]|uniref:CheY chemotaxis protein or a CheY-like REC (Receiver) domain n=1 Tax=Pedobacter insulae TaxID=414048 RepID=A0A1I2UHX8_9SPHI|nr:response regulator [Pedobacter insulae]SFG76752.1 CheY chemotaxis protein or a CheY-like REC (receiver) domain [Pedobacter insulae]